MPCFKENVSCRQLSATMVPILFTASGPGLMKQMAILDAAFRAETHRSACFTGGKYFGNAGQGASRGRGCCGGGGACSGQHERRGRSKGA